MHSIILLKGCCGDAAGNLMRYTQAGIQATLNVYAQQISELQQQVAELQAQYAALTNG